MMYKNIPGVFRDTARPMAPKPEEKEKQAATDSKRSIYGGRGDPNHIGGFLQNDTQSYEPLVWDWMIDEIQVKSVLDVGCGRGISTQYFMKRGLKVLCAEGSSDAISNHLVPNNVVQHDFSLGAYWPDDIYDAVWSVEFLEHVDAAYIPNYMAAFKKGKLIFVSHAIWGGWHHVMVRQDEWWIALFASYGFRYMPQLTKKMREKCPRLRDGETRGYTYVGYNGLVFQNMDLDWDVSFFPNAKFDRDGIFPEQNMTNSTDN